jgi:hypothetical protein
MMTRPSMTPVEGRSFLDPDVSLELFASLLLNLKTTNGGDCSWAKMASAAIFRIEVRG